MIKTLTKVKIAGIDYALEFDTERNQYQVTKEGMCVKECFVRATFDEAKGKYQQLTGEQK